MKKAQRAADQGNVTLARKYYEEVFASLVRLRGRGRGGKLKAARDMFQIDYLVHKQEHRSDDERNRGDSDEPWHKGGLNELFSHQRSRRALVASLIVMALQQACGINTLIYYSTGIILNEQNSALIQLTGNNVPTFIIVSSRSAVSQNL